MKWIALLHGIASWFDVVFNGSEHVVVLSTAPSSPGTHWYQCRLLFENPLAVNKGQQVSGKIVMDVNDNKSYNIKVDSMPPSRGAMTPLAWIDNCTPKISTSGYYHLHDQYCYVCPPLPPLIATDPLQLHEHRRDDLLRNRTTGSGLSSVICEIMLLFSLFVSIPCSLMYNYNI